MSNSPKTYEELLKKSRTESEYGQGYVEEDIYTTPEGLPENQVSLFPLATATQKEVAGYVPQTVTHRREIELRASDVHHLIREFVKEQYGEDLLEDARLRLIFEHDPRTHGLEIGATNPAVGSYTLHVSEERAA